ncbi:hypothetical protein G7046_g5228 [Stylonectria norvegica]|nr:hypothetical protein G7046_g5228 [Stylonectria norvegica]
MAETPQDAKIWQPLHPAIRTKLDPQYVAFHDKYMQYVQPDDSKTWDGTARTQPSLPSGGSTPVAVGSIEDFDIGTFRVRVYTPIGEAGERGWPVFIWYHGGGWAIGGLDDGKDFCSWVCQEARCVVVSVDYRLAPEYPFPAAVEDAIDAVRWTSSSPPELGKIDTSRIAIGGTSSGANIAIVAALSATDADITFPSAKPAITNTVVHPPVKLLLVVPVIDNMATAEEAWKPNAETAPWLTPKRMEWYRKLYFRQHDERAHWDSSPNLAPESLLRKLPTTWIAISEHDLLAPEAMEFGDQLKRLNVDTTQVIVPGGTHSILALNGVISEGRKMVEKAANHLKHIFAA